MAQWFRRSEPPRSSGGQPFSDDPGGGLDDDWGGGGGGRQRGRFADDPHDERRNPHDDNIDDAAEGHYAALTTDSLDDPDFAAAAAADAALPSPGSARAPPSGRRGWFGLGNRSASMPAVMPSRGDAEVGDGDDEEEEDDDDPDDEILRPGDHIYVWSNWTRAYQRHAIVLSAGEEEEEAVYEEGGEEEEKDYREVRGGARYGASSSSSIDREERGDGPGGCPDVDAPDVTTGGDDADGVADHHGDPEPALDPVLAPSSYATTVEVAEGILIPGAAPVPTPAVEAPAVVDDDDELEPVDAYSPRPSQPEPDPEETENDDFQPGPLSSPAGRGRSTPPPRRRRSNLALGPDGRQDEARVIVASFYPHGGSREGAAGSGPTADDVREEGAESGAGLLSGDDLTGGAAGGIGDGTGGAGLPSEATASVASSLRSRLVRRETLRAFLERAASRDDEDDDDSFGASRRKSSPWGRRGKQNKAGTAGTTKICKVRYGASITRRLLSRGGTSLPLPADPRPLVLARAQHLLSRPSSIPPYHPLSANGECAAVWCRTGRWCTAQAAGILQILFVGQAGSAVVAGGVLSQLWILVPMPGIWGVAGWFWWVPATVAYPLLVPLLVTYGLVSLVPLEVLRRYRKKWKGITHSLNHGFWSTASDDVKEYFGASQSTNEDLMSRFFGPGDSGPGGEGGHDEGEEGAGAVYMPVNAAAGGPGGDSDDDDDEDEMIRRHDEAAAAAYRDDEQADLSGRPPGERGLGPIKRRVDRIMSEWKSRGKRRTQRDFMDMAEADGESSVDGEGCGRLDTSGTLL